MTVLPVAGGFEGNLTEDGECSADRISVLHGYLHKMAP